MKKKVIAVSIISSLFTLVVVCGIILFATDGKGTDVFIKDAISKSKSINNAAQELTNKVEGKNGNKASSPASVSFRFTSVKGPSPSDA